MQVGYVDRILGKILDRMDATGLSRQALLVVTADHGAAFEPDVHRRVPDAPIVGDIAYVPLFISVPGHASNIDNRPAELADVIPTIADVLQAKAPGWKFDGTSLLAHARPNAPRTIRTPGLADVVVGPGASARDDVLARKWAQYPGVDTLADPWTVFRVGPLANLVGTFAAAAPDLPAGSFALDDATSFESVDPHAAVVPAYVLGTVRGVPDGTDVAIVLNGRVGGVGRTYEGGKLSGMVSPDAMRAGSNDLALLASTSRGLRQIPAAGAADWKLASDGRSSLVVSPDGSPARVTKGALQGSVDSQVANRKVVLVGWAALATPSYDAVHVVVFRDGKFIAAAMTGRPRPDLVRANGGDNRYANVGYVIPLDRGALGAFANAHISVYAVTGNRATKLPGLGIRSARASDGEVP